MPLRAREAEPYWLATLDFGLAYERAVLDWFDGLPEAIRGAHPPGAAQPDDASGA